jgi:hypothetical protein
VKCVIRLSEKPLCRNYTTISKKTTLTLEASANVSNASFVTMKCNFNIQMPRLAILICTTGVQGSSTGLAIRVNTVNTMCLEQSIKRSPYPRFFGLILHSSLIVQIILLWLHCRTNRNFCNSMPLLKSRGSLSSPHGDGRRRRAPCHIGTISWAFGGGDNGSRLSNALLYPSEREERR